jgi:S1-C subfamily serine protease
MARWVFGLFFVAALLLVGWVFAVSPSVGVPVKTVAQVGNVRVSGNAPAFSATATLIAPEVFAQADAAQQVLINIYQRVEPAVVNIEVNVDRSDDIDALGSGFVIDLDGHIVTNNHVVDHGTQYFVTFHDGYSVPAEVIGKDAYSDLAVLKVNVPSDRLVPVTFGDSSTLQVGERVIAIGNPFGLLSSMTTGIISATGRTLKQTRSTYSNPSIIQVDAQINPGNSGGPLLDLNGRVIGVNTAIETDTGTFQGIGFAVPSNTVQRVVPQLIASGHVAYAWLGITSVDGDKGISVGSLADRFHLPVTTGVMVTTVYANSPAEAAGLRGGTKTETFRGIDVQTGGDIIIAVNGVAVRDLDALLGYLVANSAPGETVKLTVMRGSEKIEIEVELKVRPS